jgi:hypothetical protein
LRESAARDAELVPSRCNAADADLERRGEALRLLVFDCPSW